LACNSLVLAPFCGPDLRTAPLFLTPFGRPKRPSGPLFLFMVSEVESMFPLLLCEVAKWLRCFATKHERTTANPSEGRESSIHVVRQAHHPERSRGTGFLRLDFLGVRFGRAERKLPGIETAEISTRMSRVPLPTIATHFRATNMLFVHKCQTQSAFSKPAAWRDSMYSPGLSRLTPAFAFCSARLFLTSSKSCGPRSLSSS